MASLETWSDLGTSGGTGSLDDERTVRFGKVLKNCISRNFEVSIVISKQKKLDNFNWEPRPTATAIRCQVTPSKAADKVEALVTSPTKMPSLVSSECISMNINPFLIVRIMYRIQMFFNASMMFNEFSFGSFESPHFFHWSVPGPRRICCSRDVPVPDQVQSKWTAPSLWLHWQESEKKWVAKISTKLLSLQRDMERMKESTDIEPLSIILQTASTCGWRNRHPDHKDLCNANSNGAPLWDSVQVPLQGLDW